VIRHSPEPHGPEQAMQFGGVRMSEFDERKTIGAGRIIRGDRRLWRIVREWTHLISPKMAGI
jgi:hypothetical protein